MRMGFLDTASNSFLTFMVFLIFGIGSVLIIAIGYDKGWAPVIDSWGLPLDVLFVSIFLVFMLAAIYVAVTRR